MQQIQLGAGVAWRVLLGDVWLKRGPSMLLGQRQRSSEMQEWNV